MRKPDGLLYIGDPHVTACKPGRRLDDDFLATSTGKLKKALAIAEARNLVPVITGDLVNKPYERAVLHPLIELLIDVRPYYLTGNHEGSGDDTTIGILLASRVIRPIGLKEPAVIELSTGTVHLYGANYGETIPRSLPKTAGAVNALVTHHDLEFSADKRYPGMVPPPAVTHCAFAVNGHVHDRFEPLKISETEWHNPGNILRMSRDCRDHVPAVLAMTLEDGKPVAEMIPLPDVAPHVFEPDLNIDLLDHLPETPSSSDFAQALASTAGLDRPQSDDGDELALVLDEMLQSSEIADPVKGILSLLHQEVMAEEEAKING